MTNIQFSSYMVELAEAAYADFETSNLEFALKEKGFSDSQIVEFKSNWNLVSGGHQSNTGSGFIWKKGVRSIF
jgi:hypothetical protein